MIGTIELRRTTIEIREIVKELFGFQLDGYHQLYLERRLNYISLKHGIRKASLLKDLIINDPKLAKELRKEVNISYTRLFRDPEFFKEIITLVRNQIQTTGQARIWHIGCAQGYEAYSLAILLSEELLLENCKIYASDANIHALVQAKMGIIDLKELQLGSKEYLFAGGKLHLRNYFHTSASSAILDKKILNNIIFAHHELGKDNSFQEFDIILCRNLLIYYQPYYQKRLYQSMKESLKPGGYIGLSNCESLIDFVDEDEIETINKDQNIYRIM